MSETYTPRHGEAREAEVPKTKAEQISEVFDSKSIAYLREAQDKAAILEGKHPNSAEGKKLIADIISEYLDQCGVPSDDPDRAHFTQFLEELSIDRMSDDEWVNGVKPRGSRAAEGDERGPNGVELVDSLREDLLNAEETPGGEAPSSPEDEKKMNPDMSAFEPAQILELRKKQRDAYMAKFAELSAANTADPFNLDDKRANEAMSQAMEDIQKLNDEHLKAYEDDPRYDDLRAMVEALSINAVSDREWNTVHNFGDGEKSPREHLEEWKAKLEEEARNAAEAPKEDEDRLDSDKEEGEGTEDDEEKKEGEDDDEEEVLPLPLPDDEPELPPLPPREAELPADYWASRETLRELGKDLILARHDLARLAAQRMGRKKTPGTDTFYEEAYQRYNNAREKYIRLYLQFDRLHPNPHADETERKEQQTRYEEELVKAILKEQTKLREDIRDVYLSGKWRTAVDKAAGLWNHDRALVKWGTRLSVGALASTAAAASFGGVGGAFAVVGLIKGGAMGTAAAYLGKTGKGMRTDASSDFNDVSPGEDMPFVDRVKTILDKTAEHGQGRITTETNAEHAARLKARSKKNLGKGALIGAGVGFTVGTLVNLAQALGEVPGNIKDFSDNMRDAPSRGGAGPDLDGPDVNGPSSSPSPEFSHSGPSASPSPEVTGSPDVDTGGTDHGNVNPDGSRIEPTPQNNEGLTGAADTAPDLDQLSSDAPDNIGELADAAREITLNEGPYATFDQMGIPRSMWESLYNNENLMNQLVSNGDAYPLSEQGHGFGWSHTGQMSDRSLEAIYRAAGFGGGR